MDKEQRAKSEEHSAGSAGILPASLLLALCPLLFALAPLLSAIAAPDTVIIAGPAGSLNSNDFAFWWTGTTTAPDGFDTASPTQPKSYIKGFYYRLDDEPWNWMQGRVIAYYDVPDGSHRLEVKAVDSDNVEDPSPASRSFEVRRSFAVEPNELPFSIQREFQSQLNSGIISEGLRQEFRNNGILLSQDATVSTIAQGSEWLITDKSRTYKVREEGNKLNIYEDDLLFRIHSSVQSDIQADLDNETNSQRLRDEFEDEEISLSDNATISTVTAGIEWLIVDGDKKYTVRKEGSRLNVYEDGLRFSLELVQHIINYLNNRTISEGLRQEFNNNRIILSQIATVASGSVANEWLITDSNRTYIVRKDGNKLNIYESINDSASEAILLTPGTAIKCLSQADSDDAGGVDEDWFRVAVEKQSGQPVPRQITIFFKRPDAKGSTIIKVYRHPEVGSGQGIAEFTAQYRGFFATGITPGDYLIHVSPGQSEVPTAAYFLTVTADSLAPEIIWDREHNNEPSNATETPSIFLSRGTPWVTMVGNKWGNSDNADWFRIHVDVAQPASLGLNLTRPRSGLTKVTLRPAILMSSEVGEFQVTPYSGPQWKLETGVESGDYVLEVDLAQHDLGGSEYFLTLQVSDFPSGEVWELEPNDLPHFANRLPVGVRLRATKGHPDDLKDWFRLTVPSLPIFPPQAGGTERGGILSLTTSRILKRGAVNIYLLDPVLLDPVGGPLPYEVQEEQQRDSLNLDVLAGEYLVEVDLTKLTGDYWLTALLITSLEHDAPADAPLVVGDVLSVTLVWEPGNTAKFDILEIVDGTASEPLNSEPVPMYDDGLGVYVGTYPIEDIIGDEEDEDYVRDAIVIVHLWDQASNTADIPMDDRKFNIDISPADTTPPKISEVRHDAVIKVNDRYVKAPPLSTGDKLTVTIEGESGNTATFDIGEMVKGQSAYDDGRGSSDTTADDRVYVGEYTIKAEDYISDAMITGYLTDEAGNVASLDADILVDIVGDWPVIISVEHTSTLTLGKDEDLDVTLIGDANGIASFDIEGLVNNVRMRDVGSYKYGDRDYRKYVGSYNVAEGDGALSASVTGHLVNITNGLETSKIAPLKVNIDAVAPVPVVGVEAYDRPGDQGGFLTLSWSASTEIDFAHYNIYLSRNPLRVTRDGLLVISDITDREQTSVDLEVEADLTDYFVAITAVDIMGNESILDEGGASTAGPVQALDNLRPAPVKTVEAVDRDQDFGGVIILSWTDVNQDVDFARYNIYQEVEPILSTEGLTPVDSIADRYVTVVDIPVESESGTGMSRLYYFAVTAVDLSDNESELDEFGGSVAGPVRAENNLGIEPEVPVKFLSGPVGTIHHSHVAFHWSRFRVGGEDPYAHTGYYLRLDDANWQWMTSSTAVYHDLRPGRHTFSVRPGGQTGMSVVSEQATISRSFTVVPVSTLEREPNDSRDTAHTIRAGMIVRGDNRGGDSSDWFRIHVSIASPASGGVMDILFSRPGGVGSTGVSIYADQPFRKIGHFDSSGGQPGHFALGVAPESDYFVHVDSTGDSAQYSLAVAVDRLPSEFVWEMEDNDTGASANPLRVARENPPSPLFTKGGKGGFTEVRGSSGGDQDLDWFRVHIPDTGDQHPVWMSISFHRPDSIAVTGVAIYSSFPIIESRQIGKLSVGATHASPSPGGNGYFTGVVARRGDYFIKVDNGDEPAFNAYHFLLSLLEIPADEGTAWEVEPNNRDAWANPMDIGVKQRGTSWDGDEDDWYKLNIESDGILSLHFSRPSGTGITLLELRNAALQTIGSFEVDIDSAQRGSINLDVKAGTYYVVIDPAEENPPAEYELVALSIESLSLTRLSADGEEIERSIPALRAGDVVALELVWRVEGGEATFDIGDIRTDLPMVEQQDGVYRGTYTVAEGDDEINAPITVHLEDRFGNIADIELDEGVTVDTTPPEILEISHNGITPLSAGKKLTVRMVGDTRGGAEFDIVGFKAGLDMYNMTPDVAEPPLIILSWDWRPDPTFAGDGAIIVIGEVKNVSDSVKDFVRVNVTFYDADGEVVDKDSTFTTPRGIPPGIAAPFKIYADYTGREESAKLQLVYGLDEEIVGESAGEGVYIGTYEVGDDDNISDALIICYLTDAAGNRSIAEAEGRVTFDTIPPVIGSLTHDASRVLVEGDILTVTLEGEPGGEATFDMGDFRTGLEMSGGDPGGGKYVGTYRVRAGDFLLGALIIGYLKDAAGNEATYISVRAVSINTSAPGISAVTHNATLEPFIEGETLIVTVHTDPGAAVTFDVADLVYKRPMHDDGEHDDGDPGDGVYKGSYVIRKGDNVRGGRVKVTVVSPNGKSVMREALEPVSVDTEPPAAVTGVRAVDRPDDEGGYVVLSWVRSVSEDFHHYNIYQSEQPIISLRGLEPINTDITDREMFSTEIILPPLTPPLKRGLGGFPVPSYYFAVTAVDMATNESPLTRESTDGPAWGIDNLPPPPVEKVSGYDRAYDNGKIITIVWSDPSTAEDFYRYHIYMDAVPINGSISPLVHGSMGLRPIDLSPVDTGITDRNVLIADIVVPEDGVDFFFAVTAVDTSGNESQITSDSVVGPISSEDNLGVAPDTLVKIISGPVGEIHYDDVTFRWNRWFSRGESRIRPGEGRTQGSPLPSYYYKLDNSNWVWTSDTYRTYYDLMEGEHTFYVMADVGEGSALDADPMPATRIFAVKRLLISEMEPNDSGERANWVSKGMTVFGTNADDGDDDWYRFHVESDGLVTLHFNRIGGTGTTSVTIFRSFPPTQETSIGTLIADPTGQRQSFSTGVELGDYFVLVDSQGEDPKTKYELSVTTNEMPNGVQWDRENNDLPRMAQNILDFRFSILDLPSPPIENQKSKIENTVEVSGFGNKAGDVDWFRVQVSGLDASIPPFEKGAGGISVFMDLDFVRTRGAGSTEMSIYAAFPVTESPKIGLITLQPTNNQRQRFSTPVRSGDYFLKVDSSQETDISSIYSFRVSFTPASEKWEVEPNGVLQLANLLSVDEVVKGTSWHPDDDLDWYRMRLDKRGILVLSYFRPFGTGSAGIKLKGADAGEIADASASALTGQKATISTSLNLGDYLVVVDPENEGDASAEYQLVFTVLELVELQVRRKVQDAGVDATWRVAPTASTPLSAGDVIRLTAAWEPGNTLGFDIGKLRSALPMYDDGAHDDADAHDGIYVGTYTVQAGDDVSDAEMVLHLGMPPASGSDNRTAGFPVLWTADLKLEDRVTIDTTPPKVFRVDHDMRLRPLSAGEVLNVTMTGEADARDAFFDIVLPAGSAVGSAGILPATIPRYSQIPMKEEPAGTYSGSYTVEEGDDLEAALVVCYLIDAAGNESLESSPRRISFDTTPPEIIRIDHGATEILVGGDVLTVTVASDTKAIAPGKATFSIGDLVTDRSMYDDGAHGDSAADDGVYTGRYTVRKGDNITDSIITVRLIDEAGNVSEGSAFEPLSIDTTPPEITSFVHDAQDILSAGDVLTVTLKGDPGSFATFNIGDFQTGLPMYDDGTRFDETPDDGIYVGTYTVKEGDSTKDVRITGYLTDKNGNETVLRIFERVNIDAVPPQPVISVQAVDRPDDQGFWMVLTWEASAAEDFDHYNIYRESAPIISVLGLTPLADTGVADFSLRLTDRVEVIVPANAVDYYLAVTAVDIAGNESPLLITRDLSPITGSVVGAVQALDNLAPEPITVVSAADRPDDQGKTIIVSWTKVSAAEDFDHYSIYLSDEPIVSLEGLRHYLNVSASDTIVVTGDASQVTGYGSYVTVPSDGVDFYFAVTALDESGNESPLDSEGRSVAGPIRSTDDTLPQPVIVIDVVDAPRDDGGSFNVRWQPNTDEEIRDYNFYLSGQPIDDLMIGALEPVDVVDASILPFEKSPLDLPFSKGGLGGISVISYQLHTPVDLFSFYVAVTAVDFGGNSSALDEFGRSVAGPVQSVPNTVKMESDTSIFAGFDSNTSVFIPAGAFVSGRETVDILWPDESASRVIEEANLFLERSHIDPQIDFHFADTVREFRASTANILQPVKINLSYLDVTEIDVTEIVGANLVFALSQDDERQFRIFRLNEMSRIPRWELVHGPQKVNTLQNTVSVQVLRLGIFRVARLKLPENLDRVVVYPNPFIPSQSINGYITFKNLAENVTIDVYDMVGRRVRTIPLVTGGGDEAKWYARNDEGDEVASGTYVFVIQSDEDTFIGKVVILR